MSFIYGQDEPDKPVSFISNIGYSQPRLSTVNGGPHQIKIENYSNVYQQNTKLSSEVACAHSNLQPQYSDFSKDADGHQPKQEPPLKFASELLAPSIPVSTQPSPLMQGYIPEINSCMPMLIPPTAANNKSDFLKADGVAPQKNEYCFADGSVSPGLPPSQPADPPFRKYQCLDTTVNLAQSGQPSTDANLAPPPPPPPQQQQQTPPAPPSQPRSAFVSPPRTSTVSEALFVQIIVSRCKRIAPLWFRGISSMRERNREENRRTSTNSGQTQNDWSIIGGKIREMNQIMETDTVVNLLKKLHKELPADSVLKFIKCWLGDPEALNDPDCCVLSRPDAKGRMRRIDGGKGSDKVWRLDTIVGMLYHGLPMSSTDTNIMVHTCSQELCVRPQHIRFRASSVALVIVLKALAQAGYSIIPPPPRSLRSGLPSQPSDESVDVFGPFTIEELQQYRSENLTPAGESVSRVPLNASDRDLADSLPLIRDILNRNELPKTSSTGVPPSHSAPPSTPAQPASEGGSQPARLLNGSGVVGMDLSDSGAIDIKPPFSANPGTSLPKLTPSASSRFQLTSSSAAAASSTGVTTTPTATKRRSLKRPAQSTSSASSSSNSNNNCAPPKSLQEPVTVTTTSGQTVPPVPPQPSTPSSTLPDANVFLSINTVKQLGDPQQLPTHFTAQPAAALLGCNHHAGMQPLYAPQPIGPPSVPPPPPPAPLSGKSTPRQPAKKRLEARTPTIEELGVPSAFKALHDTPFTPVLGRSGGSSTNSRDTSAPPSAAVSSTSTGGQGGMETSAAKPDDDEDEEMKTIFAGPVAARRHHSTVNQPPVSGLTYADYKSLHERLQQHAVNGVSLAGTESPNSLPFRTTPCGKRCASACALPSLSPSGVSGFGNDATDDLRQMPSLLPAPGISPPPAPSLATHRLTPGGGRQSRPLGTAATPGPGLFDRDTPGSLRNLASRFRDSPIFPTNSEILEVLVSLAQEYGVQSNRAGSSCSRPQSQHYLRRSLFLGNDSPSPAGLPLNMLNTTTPITNSASDLMEQQQPQNQHSPPLTFAPSSAAATAAFDAQSLSPLPPPDFNQQRSRYDDMSTSVHLSLGPSHSYCFYFSCFFFWFSTAPRFYSF
uniref:Nuclear factor 1 A type n=1 Tax=Echinococcus granulosus TaxID=6210 RepID=A0A068WT72_ECHGR|nr:nuclear factor 1 A type [Echinococcus granulosus]